MRVLREHRNTGPAPNVQVRECGLGPSAATPDGQAPEIRVMPCSTYQDILSIRVGYNAAISDMNKMGRIVVPSFFQGDVGGTINNVWQCARGLAGRQMYGCGGQTLEVYGDLLGLHLNENWTFSPIYRWTIFPQQYIMATLPGGLSILIDTWENIFRLITK